MNVTWWKLKNRWHNRKQPKEGGAEMSIVVKRANGKVENLGVVSREKTEWKPEAR